MRDSEQALNKQYIDPFESLNKISNQLKANVMSTSLKHSLQNYLLDMDLIDPNS